MLFFLIAVAYIVIGLLLWAYLKDNPSAADDPALEQGSVIVCARDEERDLPRCLAALEAQTVDASLLEILLIDDASTDNTARLMDVYAEKSRFQVQVHHLPPAGPEEPTGKWRPLKHGIEQASHNGILILDGDGFPPPSWAEKHLQGLKHSSMVGGFALVEGKGLWPLLQRLDWIFMIGAGAALAEIGHPQSALGKNLSFRKDDYLARGGFDHCDFSITEDQTLVMLLTEEGGRLSFPVDPEMMIATPPAPGWNSFVDQRQRWASGLNQLKAMGMLTVGIAAVRHLFVVVGILAGSALAFKLWVTTALVDALILYRLLSKLKLKQHLWAIPLWELFYTWSAPLQALQFLLKKNVVWKDRKH